MLKLKNSTRGFTLIELLVVISVISMLSSIIYASLNSARASARDASRFASLIQIRNALEVYRVNNGQYPYFGTPGGGNNGNACNFIYYVNDTTITTGYTPGTSELIPGLIPTYISSYPFSLNKNTPRAYIYCSSGDNYYFEGYSILEKDLSANSSFAMPSIMGFTVLYNEDNEPVYANNRTAAVYSDRKYLDTYPNSR